jgi:hypothetical protein
MSYIFTKKDIDAVISALNRRNGFLPGTKLWEEIDGQQVSKVGFYHSWYDGGMKLVCTTNNRGGHRSVLKLQAKSKREFYNLICAYTAGLDDATPRNLR